jgi:hypothetical protein
VFSASSVKVARRQVVLTDLRQENADAEAKTLRDAGFNMTMPDIPMLQAELYSGRPRPTPYCRKRCFKVSPKNFPLEGNSGKNIQGPN